MVLSGCGQNQSVSGSGQPAKKYGSVLKDFRVPQDTTMNSDYTDVINEISQLLFTAIQQREPELRSIIHGLDRELYKTKASGRIAGDIDVFFLVEHSTDPGG